MDEIALKKAAILLYEYGFLSEWDKDTALREIKKRADNLEADKEALNE